MKRAKNASSMHMVFHVQSGAVEIRVHENQLTVRRGGVFQVPRGKFDFFPFLPVRCLGQEQRPGHVPMKLSLYDAGWVYA